MKSIRELFPLASAATVAANPQLSAPNGGSVRPKRSGMNKTESEFSRILEAQRRQGEILRYVFEGITLRWADMRYTPDFFVVVRHCSSMPECHQFKCIEVKGGHIWDRDIVRFKGARAYWPEFAFEMHQKTKLGEGWKRKY